MVGLSNELTTECTPRKTYIPNCVNKESNTTALSMLSTDTENIDCKYVELLLL